MSAIGGLFETAFGITLGEIVDEIGGGTASRPAGARRAGGGPLGAYFPRAFSTRRSTMKLSPPATA